MLDALRHARVLHYAITALSIASIAIFSQTNPIAEMYAQARTELRVLAAFLGRSATIDGPTSSDGDSERIQEARDLITLRVQEHVNWVLTRNLAMALGDVAPTLTVRWEVPIAHESQLPLDSDLLEIRSHFAAIPIVVEEPDLAELAWLLTSRLSDPDLASLRTLTIRIEPSRVLEDHVMRFGFESAEDGVQNSLSISYLPAEAPRQTIEAQLLGRVTRMPDLNQRTAFHNSFPQLERVFHLVEFQTPEQAEGTLREKEIESRAGPLQRLSSSVGVRMSLLIATPLLLLLLLSHIRHLLDELPGIAPLETRQIGWFPLFSDPNSRSFEILTLLLLPAAPPLSWLAVRLMQGTPIPVEDLMLYSAAAIVCLWIGASVRSELEELRACMQEPDPPQTRSPDDQAD